MVGVHPCQHLLYSHTSCYNVYGGGSRGFLRDVFRAYDTQAVRPSAVFFLHMERKTLLKLAKLPIDLKIQFLMSLDQADNQ